ncbi:MAG TPA: response regulator [Candidatus Saccharimonadales bacterium]|jgi:DNA-binding response OmpR family regulator
MTTQTPHKILIIEDDEPIRSLYELKLTQEGYAVTTAKDGALGLQAAESTTPDLILLDLRMPVMNGDEMLARMRSTAWGSGIRVIVLTNISKNEAPHALRFLHVDRYITKVHHTPSQIVDIVREVLG